MIKSIRIKNFAIVEESYIEFREGMNVITGETGSGKSIIIEAISLGLGNNISKESIRHGSDSCEVELEFSIEGNPAVSEFLEEKGLGPDGLIIRRYYSLSKNSSVYINDKKTSVNTLKTLSGLMVDIHSQNQEQSVLREDCQRSLLDAYSGTAGLYDELGKQWRVYDGLREKEASLIEYKRNVESELERLRYDYKELSGIELYEGIDEEIEKEFRLISNLEHLAAGVKELYYFIYESEGSIMDNLAAVQEKLSGISSFDSKLKDSASRLESVMLELEDLSEEFRTYCDNIEYSPGAIDKISSRRDKLFRLKSKYGSDLGRIIEYRDRLREKLDTYEDYDVIIADITEKKKKAYEKVLDIVRSLSSRRKKGAASLKAAVEKNLSELGMQGARFEIRMEKKEIDRTGADSIGFMISTNMGEPLGKLKEIASGGEISRIMLSLKAALSEYDRVPVLIFDEIDTGIGATIGRKVGILLEKISSGHQILLVTHLGSIARHASSHFKVEKENSGSRTVSVVRELDYEERRKELARLISGRKSPLGPAETEMLLKMQNE